MCEKYVLRGPPLSVPPIKCSAGKYLYDTLLKNIDNGVAFLNEQNNETITYKSLLEISCQLAVSLRNFGLTSDSMVATSSENSIYYIIPVLSSLFEGIPVTPVNPLYTEYEMSHAFKVVIPNIVFCSMSNVERILKLRTSTFKSIREVVVLNSTEDILNSISLRTFINKYSHNVQIRDYQPKTNIDINNHVALIMFSSGTTGLPKGVMITHKNFNMRRAVMIDPNVIYQPKVKVTLGLLPFFHIFGLNTIITGLMHGRMVIVLDKFDPVVYLSTLEKYQIENILAPPSILRFLAKSPLVDKFNLTHVKDILAGSAPISRALEEAVKKRISVKFIRQGYSMTEATATSVSIPRNTERFGSCGKLYPEVIGVVKDIETGENLGPLKTGELCFKGDTIMKGYYNNKSATEEVFSKDGYLRTGDVGYYDNDGYFYIIDRFKELIKYKGFQVAPAELEMILIAHPEIKDAAVVGIPDDDAGELPAALIVKEPNSDLLEEEVNDYLSKYVSKNKYLHGGVRFVVDIPRNSLGKVVRREVKAMAAKIWKSKL